MQRSLIPVACVAATSGVALGAVVTFDLSGFESRDFAGDPDNFLFELVPSEPQVFITHLAWDVNLTTFSPSWADEVTITITDSVGAQAVIAPGIGDAFSVQNENYSGTSSTGLLFRQDQAAYLEIHERGFDDLPDAADALFEDGSWLRLEVLTGDFDIKLVRVPTPGTIALLGLGGLIGSRRRRV